MCLYNHKQEQSVDVYRLPETICFNLANYNHFSWGSWKEKGPTILSLTAPTHTMLQDLKIELYWNFIME